FVYVDDVADAVVAALTRVPRSQVINIGSGTEATVRDVCLLLARTLGAREQLLGFGELAMRPDEPGRYVLDVTRAGELLASRATTSLADGLARLAHEDRPA